MDRRFTKIDLNSLLSETKGAKRANGIRCMDCPKCSNLWCSVLAKTVKRDDPACSYGKLVIRADKTAKKRGGRKIKSSNV